jgi:hypothetical protein
VEKRGEARFTSSLEVGDGPEEAQVGAVEKRGEARFTSSLEVGDGPDGWM